MMSGEQEAHRSSWRQSINLKLLRTRNRGGANQQSSAYFRDLRHGVLQRIDELKFAVFFPAFTAFFPFLERLFVLLVASRKPEF